jgi:single-strand DNA-binding protein
MRLIMNKIYLIGNLVKDVETAHVQRQSDNSMIQIAKLSLAVRRVKKIGDQDTDYFNLTCYDKVADIMSRYAKKGHKIAIIGFVTNKVWEKDGVKKYEQEITVSEVEFLTSKSDGERLEREKIDNLVDQVNDSSNTLPKAPTFDLSELPAMPF